VMLCATTHRALESEMVAIERAPKGGPREQAG
jgi:hypothetical protein